MDTGPEPTRRAAILIGAPGCGKSTWAQALLQKAPGAVIVSSDEFIVEAANAAGKTYSEVFKDEIEAAGKKAEDKMMRAILEGANDIIIDRTNMTKASRAPWIEKLKFHGYQVHAIVFSAPEKEEHQRRLDSRPGKIIPPEAVAKMLKSFEAPHQSEGFVGVVNL